MDREPGAPPAELEDLRGELERLRLLHTISQDFSSSLDFDELLPKVFDSVLSAVGAQGGSIWIAEGDVLRCRLALGAASQKRVGTLMATPMVTKGVTVGAIQVTNKVTGDGIFDDRDRQVLEGLAASAAVALRNAQLHAAEKRARDLALLLEISREITATLDLDTRGAAGAAPGCGFEGSGSGT